MAGGQHLPHPLNRVSQRRLQEQREGGPEFGAFALTGRTSLPRSALLNHKATRHKATCPMTLQQQLPPPCCFPAALPPQNNPGLDSRRLAKNLNTRLGKCAVQRGVRWQLLRRSRRLANALHRGGLERARQEEVEVDQEGQLVPAQRALRRER